MGHNLAHLASQGRAYSAGRPWEAEELKAVILFVKERGLGRDKAADYVRSGILTLADLDKATKNQYVPKTLDQAHEEAEARLKEEGKKAVKGSKKTK